MHSLFCNTRKITWEAQIPWILWIWKQKSILTCKYIYELGHHGVLSWKSAWAKNICDGAHSSFQMEPCSLYCLNYDRYLSFFIACCYLCGCESFSFHVWCMQNRCRQNFSQNYSFSTEKVEICVHACCMLYVEFSLMPPLSPLTLWSWAQRPRCTLFILLNVMLSFHSLPYCSKHVKVILTTKVRTFFQSWWTRSPPFPNLEFQLLARIIYNYKQNDENCFCVQLQSNLPWYSWYYVNKVEPLWG